MHKLLVVILLLSACGNSGGTIQAAVSTNDNICQVLYEVMGSPEGFVCQIPEGCYVADPVFDRLNQVPIDECNFSNAVVSVMVDM